MGGLLILRLHGISHVEGSPHSKTGISHVGERLIPEKDFPHSVILYLEVSHLGALIHRLVILCEGRKIFM